MSSNDEIREAYEVCRDADRWVEEDTIKLYHSAERLAWSYKDVMCVLLALGESAKAAGVSTLELAQTIAEMPDDD